MIESWLVARSSYDYRVNLNEYRNGSHFPNYFKKLILGDRSSTIEFENYFRAHCTKIQPWFEVVFWKMNSQDEIAQDQTDRIIKQIPGSSASNPEILIKSAKRFMESLSEKDFDNFTRLLGYTSAVATVATFPAFLDPEQFPMVDTRVAKWVNKNYPKFNAAYPNGPQLIPSVYDNTSPDTTLTMKDFSFYIHWIHWTRYMAQKLFGATELHWRARDVEMAVFTAWGDKGCKHPIIILEPF